MNLAGSIVALVTPMDESGAVDYMALSELIEHHIECGTHAIVSVGTTGESSTLSPSEHLAVISATIKAVHGRIPVIAGTGSNSTHEAIYLTQQAADLGADAVLLVVPYYNKPTQEGLYRHFKSIAEAVDIPQILYNVPGRTVADMSNQTIARLSQLENVVGCKDATGDLVRGKELIAMVGDQISIFSGDDLTALEYMKLGAKGDISVTANVAPKLMSKMCNAALAGDFDTADALDAQLRGLHTDLFVESNPIPVKYATSKLGYGANVLRLPLTPISSEFEGLVDAAMRQANLL